jgi:UDP-glucose 4-epimerase
VFGDGTQTRCFCDGRDVAGALPQLMRSPTREHRVYNIGSDRPISIRDLAELVITTLGSSSTLELVPYERAYPSGFEDLRHRKPDLDRIRSAIGFAPNHTLNQTIEDLHRAMFDSNLIRGRNA